MDMGWSSVALEVKFQSLRFSLFVPVCVTHFGAEGHEHVQPFHGRLPSGWLENDAES